MTYKIWYSKNPRREETWSVLEVETGRSWLTGYVSLGVDVARFMRADTSEIPAAYVLVENAKIADRNDSAMAIVSI